MAPYHPQQRVVPARILTPSGWVRASFHVVRLVSFRDFLGQVSPFFSLTGVSFPGSAEELPFLALRRSAARLILPACDERRLLLGREPEELVSHQVTCLLESGALRGRLALPPHVRISDFLAHHAGFVPLREADVGPRRTRVPIVFVNAAALVAVAQDRAAPEDRAALPVMAQAAAAR
jgi:hypothetical protein